LGVRAIPRWLGPRRSSTDAHPLLRKHLPVWKRGAGPLHNLSDGLPALRWSLAWIVNEPFGEQKAATLDGVAAPRRGISLGKTAQLSGRRRQRRRCGLTFHQRSSLDKFHGEEMHAVGLLHREHGDNVGWLRAATARASRRKRLRNSGSRAMAAGRTLSATSRPSLVSAAR
jgi:hypothetical protein